MQKLRRMDPARGDEIRRSVEEFAGTLKRTRGVEAVYVYGSYVTGELHEGSDIDMVVVADFPEPFLERIVRVLAMTDLPIEPLVYTEAEFQAMREGGNPLVREVLETGTRL